MPLLTTPLTFPPPRGLLSAESLPNAGGEQKRAKAVSHSSE